MTRICDAVRRSVIIQSSPPSSAGPGGPWASPGTAPGPRQHPTRGVRHLRAGPLTLSGARRGALWAGPMTQGVKAQGRVANGVPKSGPRAGPMTRCVVSPGLGLSPAPGPSYHRPGPRARPSAGRASRSTGRAHDAVRRGPGPP